MATVKQSILTVLLAVGGTLLANTFLVGRSAGQIETRLKAVEERAAKNENEIQDTRELFRQIDKRLVEMQAEQRIWHRKDLR